MRSSKTREVSTKSRRLGFCIDLSSTLNKGLEGATTKCCNKRELEAFNKSMEKLLRMKLRAIDEATLKEITAICNSPSSLDRFMQELIPLEKKIRKKDKEAVIVLRCDYKKGKGNMSYKSKTDHYVVTFCC